MRYLRSWVDFDTDQASLPSLLVHFGVGMGRVFAFLLAVFPRNDFEVRRPTLWNERHFLFQLIWTSKLTSKVASPRIFYVERRF